MTAARRVGGPLTVAEYLELGEDDQHRWELQEGALVELARPTPQHNLTSFGLAMTLEPLVPAQLVALPHVDVDLCLAAPDRPGTVRRPDVVIVDWGAVERTDADGGILWAGDVTLIVEVVMPGAPRMDRVIKRHEYADAGIPHYWIIDLGPPVSLVACRLGGEGYQDSAPVTGLVELAEPFPVRFDLSRLR